MDLATGLVMGLDLVPVKVQATDPEKVLEMVLGWVLATGPD